MFKFSYKCHFLYNSRIFYNNLFSIISFPFSKGEIKVPRCELSKMVKEKENVLKKQVRSSGPGGQHVNKTESAVMLRDLKTNITVKVSNSRDSIINKGIAQKRLVDKLDSFYNGSESKIAKKIERAKKQKDRSRRRSETKHQKKEECLPNLASTLNNKKPGK